MADFPQIGDFELPDTAWRARAVIGPSAQQIRIMEGAAPPQDWPTYPDPPYPSPQPVNDYWQGGEPMDFPTYGKVSLTPEMVTAICFGVRQWRIQGYVKAWQEVDAGGTIAATTHAFDAILGDTDTLEPELPGWAFYAWAPYQSAEGYEYWNFYTNPDTVESEPLPPLPMGDDIIGSNQSIPLNFQWAGFMLHEDEAEYGEPYLPPPDYGGDPPYYVPSGTYHGPMRISLTWANHQQNAATPPDGYEGPPMTEAGVAGDYLGKSSFGLYPAFGTTPDPPQSEYISPGWSIEAYGQVIPFMPEVSYPDTSPYEVHVTSCVAHKYWTYDGLYDEDTGEPV